MGNIGESSELLEDIHTPYEASHFNKPLTTVSSSIDESEQKERLTKIGIWFSKVFKEKNHAILSYEYEKLNKEFNKRYFGKEVRLF